MTQETIQPESSMPSPWMVGVAVGVSYGVFAVIAGWITVPMAVAAYSNPSTRPGLFVDVMIWLIFFPISLLSPLLDVRQGVGASGMLLVLLVNAFLWGLGSAGIYWPIHQRLSLARRRIKRGQCPACGYSLRGITGPTCPECGTPHHARRIVA